MSVTAGGVLSDSGAVSSGNFTLSGTAIVSGGNATLSTGGRRMTVAAGGVLTDNASVTSGSLTLDGELAVIAQCQGFVADGPVTIGSGGLLVDDSYFAAFDAATDAIYSISVLEGPSRAARPAPPMNTPPTSWATSATATAWRLALARRGPRRAGRGRRRALGSATTSPSGPATAFEVEAIGTGDGQYSEYSVDSGSSLDLNGAELASVVCLDGYVPADGDTLTIVALWNSTSSVTGNFTDASGNPLADGATIPAVNASGPARELHAALQRQQRDPRPRQRAADADLGAFGDQRDLHRPARSGQRNGQRPDEPGRRAGHRRLLLGVPHANADRHGHAAFRGRPTRATTRPRPTSPAARIGRRPAARPADFTISQATLTVTANPASRHYGASDPAYSDTITGFVLSQTLGDSGVTGAPSLSSGDTAASSVGTYAITAALGTLAAQNYTFGFASGVLSVTPATLTVSANNAGRLYGASDPAYSDTITGFVPSQTLGNSGVTGAEPLQQRHGRQLGGHLRDHRRLGHPGRAELHVRLRQRRLERHASHLDGLCQ